MGFWGGPDSIYHSVSAGYRVYDKFYVCTDFTFLIQGENSILTEFPSDMTVEEAKLTTPSGSNPQKTGVISLHGELNFIRFFTFTTDLYFIKVWNYEHHSGAEEKDIQWVFSIMFHLEK